MIGWDMFQLSQKDKESTENIEEEIDITSDLEGGDNSPIIVEVTPDSHKLKVSQKKAPEFPFPWTSEQIKKAFETLELDEECKELENVVFFEQNQYKQAV